MNLFNLDSDADASHLASVSKVDLSLSRVGTSSNQINQDVGNLRDDSLNSWLSSVGSGVEGELALLALRDMVRAHEGADGLSGQQFINVVVTKMKRYK